MMKAGLQKVLQWRLHLRAAVATLAVATLAGCANLPSANPGAEEGVFSRPEQNSERGGVELILYPVAVWGDGESGSPVAAEVAERQVYVRKRRSTLTDRPRVKMGLFWNSRGKNIYVLVEVSGPPADIRSLELHYDDGGQKLTEVHNVRLRPGRTTWDGGDGKTPAAFAIKPEVFADVLASKIARVLVRTGTGVLTLDLGALADDSQKAMRHNAKILFWQFYDDMIRIRKQKEKENKQ